MPTVFLHGWMDNCDSFLPVIKHLNKIHAISIDLPGHGKSSHLKSVYSLDFYIHTVHSLIKKILDDAKTEKSQLSRTFIRGVIGSLIVAMYPDIFNKVIFIEAFGPLVDSPENTVNRLKSSLHSRDSANKPPKLYDTLEKTIKARVQSGDISYSSVEILAKRGVSQTKDKKYFWNHDRYLKVPSPIRFTEEAVKVILNSIDKEVFTIYGTSPLDLAKPHIKNRLTYYKSVKCEILPGGHHLHMEPSSRECAEAIEKYINS